jgi:hypothetical protein
MSLVVACGQWRSSSLHFPSSSRTIVLRILYLPVQFPSSRALCAGIPLLLYKFQFLTFFPRFTAVQQIEICSPLFRTSSLLCLGVQDTTHLTQAVRLFCGALFKTRINSPQISFPFSLSGIDSSRFTLRIVARFILCLWSPVDFFGDTQHQV